MEEREEEEEEEKRTKEVAATPMRKEEREKDEEIRGRAARNNPQGLGVCRVSRDACARSGN